MSKLDDINIKLNETGFSEKDKTEIIANLAKQKFKSQQELAAYYEIIYLYLQSLHQLQTVNPLKIKDVFKDNPQQEQYVARVEQGHKMAMDVGKQVALNILKKPLDVDALHDLAAGTEFMSVTRKCMTETEPMQVLRNTQDMINCTKKISHRKNFQFDASSVLQMSAIYWIASAALILAGAALAPVTGGASLTMSVVGLGLVVGSLVGAGVAGIGKGTTAIANKVRDKDPVEEFKKAEAIFGNVKMMVDKVELKNENQSSVQLRK